MTGGEIWALSLATSLSLALVGIFGTLLMRVDAKLDRIEETLARLAADLETHIRDRSIHR